MNRSSPWTQPPIRPDAGSVAPAQRLRATWLALLYHGLVHIIFSYLGLFIQSDLERRPAYSSWGRANGYGEKYRSSGKVLTAIGVNRSDGPVCAETRSVDDWLAEPL